MAAPSSPPSQQRPRAFSYRSDKSGHSGRNKPIDLTESHEEKRERRLTETTKANPNAAMNEAQPIAAALEKPTLGSLRSIQHVDSSGVPIAEPDLSNPTRPRWERPLDTIRSFEAAIDGSYNKRSSMVRSETAPSVMGGYASRRSSYFGGYDQPGNQRYSQVGGYYGNSNGNRSTRDSYLENDYGSAMYGPPSRNRFSQRIAHSAQHQQGQDLYDGYGSYQQNSRDNVSSPSDQWGNSTNPTSSGNSSMDRISGMPGHDAYGQRGHGPPSQFNNPALDQYYGQNGGNGHSPSPTRGGPVQDPYAPTSPHGPPPVPAHDPSYGRQEPRSVIKLGGNGPSSAQPLSPTSGNKALPVRPPIQSTPSQKKKSWLKRRFSKD